MRSRELRYLLLIIAVFIAACLETDIYLPAFPDMMRYFAIDEATIQGLLTWNFVGICLSGPFYGPLSDAYGRRKPLMAALGLFLVGSILTFAAPSFGVILWGRVLQGLGSGGCFTLGTAIIFDAFQAEEAIVAVNRLNSIIPFIMAGAPMLGGYLNHVFGFRANFLAVVLLVLASFITCVTWYSETLPPEKRAPLRLRKVAGDFRRAATCVPFWQLTVSMCLLFAMWMAFLSTTSVLFVLELGVPKARFPFYQAVPLFAWLVASLTCRGALERWGTLTLKKSGMALTALGGVVLVLSAAVAPRSPAAATGAMALFAFGINWFQSIYFPECMEMLPDIKGVTASLITSARLLIAAVMVGITSHLYNRTIYPVAIALAIVLVVSIPTMVLYELQRAGRTAPSSD